jgi:hypothetical protein
MTGLTKFRGTYYCNGQAALQSAHPTFTRHLDTFASTDFETWSAAPAMGLDRSPDLVGPSIESEWNIWEEIHLGAAMWNRGNVIVGVYGMWHGHPSGDRRLVTMDLGLALSHDALYYYEPIPDFKIVPAREQPGSVWRFMPALMQGQAFANLGGQTMFWYGLWAGFDGSGVRMASWDQDRLGFLQGYNANPGRAMSLPLEVVADTKARVYLNAGGLGEHSRLRVGLVDEAGQPIAGYSGEDAAVVAADGLRIPIRFNGGELLTGAQGRVRLDIQFEGLRARDARLYAATIETEA